MKRKLFSLAIALIFIGIIGMAANKFKFGEELISYQNRWDLQHADSLNKIKIISDAKMNFVFEESRESEGYIAIDGTLEPKQVEILQAFSPSNSAIDLDLTLPDSIQFMSVGFRSPKGKITIALPSGMMLDELELSTLSDNIQVSGASSKTISISAKSGNITMNGIRAEHLNAETYSGNIRGSDIKASTRLINLSGNVVMKDLEGPSDIEVTSGNVNVELLGVSSVNILNRSGDVKVQPDSSFRGFYDLKSWTGSISAPESLKETTDTIQVQAYSGDIHIVQ